MTTQDWSLIVGGGARIKLAGSRLYAFKVIATPGKFKDGGKGVWSAQEIADNWDAINKA